MGIPYYFSHLIKNHNKIIKNINHINSYNNLYLDSNSIIYDSIDFSNFKNNNQFENFIIQSVINKLENIIKIINPTNLIYITFDGVPPISKLKQQKNRRYKSWHQNNILNKTTIWDTASITPGTQFMKLLNNKITNHFNKIITNCKIILNLSDKPGEGEHKIFQYIRDNNINKYHNNIIYGMDADLIMLSLNHLKYCNSIYLYRETPIFIQSLDSSLSPDKTYLIHINELSNEIYKLLSHDNIDNNNIDIIDNIDNIDKDIYHNKIEDYIFICFLLGNDFMPHFPAINIRINGFTLLLELYKSLFNNNKYLTKNGKIIWSNFKLFIKKLADNEYNSLLEIYSIRNKLSKKFYPETNDEEKERKFIALPSWERNIENFINPHEEDWEFRYYYSLFDINIDEDKNAISNICMNYLQTLQWTYYYYSTECVNWSHSYNYDYPPLLVDLYKHIPYFDSELILKQDKQIIHEYVLLSYVLSRNSLSLLPIKIHNYLLENYESYYKTDYEVSYSFCKYFWEGHVKFPELNFNDFEKNILKLIK